MEKSSPSWRPLVAYVLPFVVFMVLTPVEGLEDLRSWFPVLYGIKTLCILGAVWWGRRYYPSWSWKGIGWGLVFGLAGGVGWIVLCVWNIEQGVLPGILSSVGQWLNMPSLAEWLKPGNRLGYNPFADLSPASGWSFAVVRLIGMVIAVPLMEELFWRGFLNRALINDDWRDIFNDHWDTVPWGKVTRFSSIVVTLLFVSVHTEWTAALFWGTGIMVVYWSTRNLWACVVAHAASNAVLGYYILAYEQWGLW